MHTCKSYFECLDCRRRVCAVAECRRELSEADTANMAHLELAWRCPTCAVNAASPNRLADKLLELREAWLDVPFNGIVPKGWGDPMANLLAAVTAIVDPDRTLRETADAKRRGDIASFRVKAEWYADQAEIARTVKAGDSKLDPGTWARKLDEAIAECRERWGVELTVSTERKPWTP